jgi:hypothetical protein
MLSDVLVLVGFLKIILAWASADVRPLVGPFAALMLFLGLYHISMLFALSFAWLGFTDVHVIDRVAKGSSAFEIAFTAVQFSVVLILWTPITALEKDLPMTTVPVADIPVLRGWQPQGGSQLNSGLVQKPEAKQEEHFVHVSSHLNFQLSYQLF